MNLFVEWKQTLKNLWLHKGTCGEMGGMDWGDWEWHMHAEVHGMISLISYKYIIYDLLYSTCSIGT